MPGSSGWTWRYDGYDPSGERVREALCTLGNGFFATRGAAPECPADDVHYPGTYVAGCYDRLSSAVGGRRVTNEDIVNLPNWLPLRVRARAPGGAVGPWFTPDSADLLDYRQRLDLRAGVLVRELRYRDPVAGAVRIDQRRLVSMDDPHLAAMRTEFTAEDWSGELEVESVIEGEVVNANVGRYQDLSGRHLRHVTAGTARADTVWLLCRTRSSRVEVAMAVRTAVAGAVAKPGRPEAEPSRAVHRLVVTLAAGGSAIVDKTVAVHTSRDRAIGAPLAAAIDGVRRARTFPDLLAAHTRAWSRLWRDARLDVPGEAGAILRLHLFHVLQTLSPHTAELDTGVPARGLHGEAYRGHVFWDELFVLPYLNLHFPDVSRAMLDYRYRRLGAAVRLAQEEDRQGARYPWQSGSDGREETQRLHLNPRSGRWLPDHSRLQYHVGPAIAYNVWNYCEATGDTAYLHTRGAEMLLRIARFWEDTAVFDPAADRFRIRGVVGPDEYHDRYPDAERPGLDDNAYTNVMVAWALARAAELAEALPARRRRELLERMCVDAGAPARWDALSRRLRVPFHHGVISQFEGYGDLAELDWAAYRRRYGDIRRLDRILEAEGDTVNRYQASKQADVLMLGYLFGADELAGIFARLGYELPEGMWQRTVDYYLGRTSHGSTLSGLVHAWVLARARRTDTWRFVQEALGSDVADLQGGTTGEGIHLGAMAGTLDLVQRGLTGLRTRDGALWLDPAPLPQLSSYGFSLRYRGHEGIAVTMRGDEVRIAVPDSAEAPLRVVMPDRAVMIAPGETRVLAPASSDPRARPEAEVRPDSGPPGR